MFPRASRSTDGPENATVAFSEIDKGNGQLREDFGPNVLREDFDPNAGGDCVLSRTVRGFGSIAS